MFTGQQPLLDGPIFDYTGEHQPDQYLCMMEEITLGVPTRSAHLTLLMQLKIWSLLTLWSQMLLIPLIMWHLSDGSINSENTN